MLKRLPASKPTAAEKLLLLSLNSFCDLILNSLILRGLKEELNPDRLRKLSHRINDLADEAERKAWRQQR